MTRGRRGSSRAAWHGFGHLGPRGPRGRPAGAGHPRLHRQRRDHAGAAQARWPRPAGGSTVEDAAGTSAPAPTRSSASASASTASPRQADPGRRLEPRRRLRPGARPRPSRPCQRRRHPRHARSPAIPRQNNVWKPLRMGRRAPGRRTRRSRASPTSRPVPHLAIWSRARRHHRPRAARGLAARERQGRSSSTATTWPSESSPKTAQGGGAGNRQLS